MTFEEVPKPTGDVSAVCWSLLGTMAVALVAVIKWFSGKLDSAEKKTDEKDKENDRLRDERLADKEKLLAQAHVTLNTLMAKKRGESPT